MTVGRKGARGRRPAENPRKRRVYVVRDRDGAFHEVGIAELKAHLSENLARVRRGEEVTVFDRSTPVAKIVPLPGGVRTLAIRKPQPGAPHPSTFRAPPAISRAFRGFDPVTSLLEDRDGR